jgi:hypothetical protein
MASKKHVVSAIVGLAMFALPATALAGHHHDRDDQTRPSAWHDQGLHRGWLKHHGQYAARPIEDEDDQGEHRHYRHNYQLPAFLCDEDGDNCEPTHHGYGGHDYRPPVSYYKAQPPVGYRLMQRPNWFIQHRRPADGGYMAALPYYGAPPNSNYKYNPNSMYGQNYADNANSAFNPGYGASPPLNAVTGMLGSLFGESPY